MHNQYHEEEYLLQTEQEGSFNKQMELLQQQLSNAVITGNEKGFREAIRKIRFETAPDYMERNLEIARFYLAGYLAELKTTVMKAGLPGYIAEDFIRRAYVALSETKTVTELERLTSKCFRELFELYQKYSLAKFSPVVKRAINHIHMKRMQPLSAGMIADHLGLDSTYLARVFKAETGKTMTEFINAVKCDAAEEMILRRNHSLHEISDLLGFSSYSYFSKVYKKVKGLPPTQV